MNFFDQYKSPEWQRKRLEVLADSEWACEDCGDDSSQLHVHHKQYIKGRKVWEYSRKELACLCEKCHAEAHKNKDRLSLLIAKMDSGNIESLIGYAMALNLDAEPAAITSYEQAFGFADAFSIDGHEVIDALMAMSRPITSDDVMSLRASRRDGSGKAFSE
jgi:hypothetical protein